MNISRRTQDNLLALAKMHGTPILAGNTATFVWRGKRPPVFVSDVNGWELNVAAQLTERAPGVWAHTLELPADSYVEYAFLRPGDGVRLPDPFNLHTTPNGLGHNNHYFYMPGGGATEWTKRGRGGATGRTTKHVVEAGMLVTGGKRAVHLYQPPTTGPCPLLVVYDGDDYLRRVKMPVMVDNLIAARRISPVALALVSNGRQARFVEYACNDATVGFLLQCVLPLAHNSLNLLDWKAHKGSFGVAGASMGGVMALYTALRAGDVFGNVLSQSGAFRIHDYELAAFELVRARAAPQARIWMDAGKFEWLLDANRDMHTALSAGGYAVAYREYNGGHNYPCWRDDIARGLQWLFPYQPSS